MTQETTTTYYWFREIIKRNNIIITVVMVKNNGKQDRKKNTAIDWARDSFHNKYSNILNIFRHSTYSDDKSTIKRTSTTVSRHTEQINQQLGKRSTFDSGGSKEMLGFIDH